MAYQEPFFKKGLHCKMLNAIMGKYANRRARTKTMNEKRDSVKEKGRASGPLVPRKAEWIPWNYSLDWLMILKPNLLWRA